MYDKKNIWVNKLLKIFYYQSDYFNFLAHNMYLKINPELYDYLKVNLNSITKEIIQESYRKFPENIQFYETYLKSETLKRLMCRVKRKYDKTYLKLFIRKCLKLSYNSDNIRLFDDN